MSENRVFGEVEVHEKSAGSDVYTIVVRYPESSKDWTEWRAALAVETTDLLKYIMKSAEERLLLMEPELAKPSDPPPGKRHGRR